MTIGIMGAMEEEVRDLLPVIRNLSSKVCGSRTFYLGSIEGKEVVVALSRIGKVASASTATTLIDHFKASTIIFTGVAGGVAPQVRIGDVVLASQVLQCDVDGSAIMGLKRFEIPGLGRIYFDLSSELRNKARDSILAYIKTDKAHAEAQLHEGIIGSCDQFVIDLRVKQSLATEIPGLLAVEMEGGAVGQVCYEWNIPLVVIRSISDTADHNSPKDFNEFLVKVAAPLSAGVVISLLRTM